MYKLFITKRVVPNFINIVKKKYIIKKYMRMAVFYFNRAEKKLKGFKTIFRPRVSLQISYSYFLQYDGIFFSHRHQMMVTIVLVIYNILLSLLSRRLPVLYQTHTCRDCCVRSQRAALLIVNNILYILYIRIYSFRENNNYTGTCRGRSQRGNLGEKASQKRKKSG